MRFSAVRFLRIDVGQRRAAGLSRDIHKIVDVFNRQLEMLRYSRMVTVSEIASPANDYNLNTPRYIDSSEPEDLHDLDAHLRGGIPEKM